MTVNIRKNAPNQVYDFILGGLIDRKYPPPHPLHEELRSTTPVRETFRQLGKEDWLINQPHKDCSLRDHLMQGRLHTLEIIRRNSGVTCRPKKRRPKIAPHN